MTLALTPPMGWNSYNTFCCEPDERLIIEIADAMVATGLRDAGYLYVNIDDGWMAKERDLSGNLYPRPDKFPGDLKKLTDYIHSRGMKAGIYLGCGLRTYGEYPGSLGFEQQDAALIAAWGFDLLKYDRRCLPEDPPGRDSITEYELMSNCLESTGRPILFSICEHGHARPWEWGKKYGHMWRTTPDIKDCFEGEYSWGWSFNKILDHNCELYEFAGPGGWNDPDMLIVGLHGTPEWMGPGCTDREYRTHFSLWCLSAAPLFIGCDVRQMSEATRETLLNPEVIAVNQDKLGKQGQRIKNGDGTEIWIKLLENDAWAIGLYNRTDSEKTIELKWSDLGLTADSKRRIRDLWARQDLGVYQEVFSREVAPHECMVIKVGN